MKQKPFWRRVNRGFLVSMVLLTAVLIYVLVTQLMLIPQRRQLADLANRAGDAIMSVENLSEPGTPTPQRKAMYLERLNNALKPLFSEDSEYLTEAGQGAVEALYSRLEIDQKIETQQRSENKITGYTIDEDVATVTLENTYALSGQLYIARDDTIENVDNAIQRLNLRLIMKKVGEEWRIYRISSLSTSDTMLDGRGR